MQNYAWLLLALPLLGFVITGGYGRRLSRAQAGAIGSGVIGGAFLVSLVVFAQVLGQAGQSRFNDLIYYRWLDAGTFHLNAAILIDPLTCIMLLVITGVGFLIHVYSIGYMEHDANVSRFFSYLNLFIFSMLILVLADNFLTLTIGWGMVGLSSYLLIGFWFDRPSAVAAARKAFVMNVIGDVGMMIACYLLFVHFGTLSYDTLGTGGLGAGVFNQAQHTIADSGWMNAICLMLLVGATAKSAQIPLYTWLPDAMEGPTPVSALIHAATMVTAGVYLIARSHVLFEMAPFALSLVAIIGAAGAIYAASMGLVQRDIKRVLAYSTMSQIGYMFLGCGVGAFSAGIFHLMTHAFFKAALFLGAGNIIHALHDEQDLMKMGGLRGKLPRTYLAMGAACLAISGIVPFAGFFSKDEILGAVLNAGGWYVILWVVGVITAGMTAFYMFRLFFLAFHGTHVGPREVFEHAHEAPSTMIVPVSILGVLALVGGWVQIFTAFHPFGDFLGSVFTRYPLVHPVTEITPNWLAVIFALLVAGVGIYGAYTMYGGATRRPYAGLKPLYNVLYHKYYIDEIYTEAFAVPLRVLARVLYTVVDREGIDAMVNGSARLVRRVSLTLSPIESGYVRAYALSILVGVVFVSLVPVLFGTVFK